MHKNHKLWGTLLVALTLIIVIVNGMPKHGSAEQSSAAPAVTPAAEKKAEAAATPAPAAAAEKKEATAAAAPAAASASPAALYPVSATKKALENNRYEMYVDEKSGNIRVVDKTTKKEWLGAPQLERSAMPNVKKFTDAPVHVRYTEGGDITQTYPLKDEDSKVTVQVKDKAVRAEFNFTKLGISFAQEYRLTDNGFEVTIPRDSIKEESKYRLTSLEPLPFLNAAGETDTGAMLLPDGSGALLEFRKNHPAYLRGYSEFIYGSDPTFYKQNHDYIDEKWMKALAPKEAIALPVFGIYKNGTGYLGIVTEGETDTKINGIPSGIRSINLYRASAEFIFRKDDVIFVGSSGQIPYYQGQLQGGDRKLRYVLLEGQDANYVGMAKTYRNYLVNEKGVKPVVQDTVPLNIHVLGGILRDEVIGSTFIEMTTFDQVKEMIDSYAAQGITALEITIDGWSEGGLYGNQPDHFPVDKNLGGSKDFKELQKYAKDKGVAVYLQANYVRAYSDSEGMKKSKDAVKGMNREVLKSPNYYLNTPWNIDDEMFYLMKPGRMFENRVSKEVKEFADLGVTGVQFKYLGNMLYSDQENNAETDRKFTLEQYVKTLDIFKQQVGKTAVDYGFAYTLGLVDRIDNAPMDSSGFVYTDRAVPFFQLALHGLVPYVAKPANLNDDSVVEPLKALEYGALPSYELTYEPTSKLQRTIEDRLFSSAFQDWFGPSVEEYRKWKDVYAKIMNQQMTNHEELQQNVFQTTYANGVKVIVNYNKQPAAVNGQSVKGQSYTVTGG